MRLFRVDKNMHRMNTSAERICLPEFDGAEAAKLIGQLAKLDSAWIPEGRGYSMYLRPSLIGTTAALGVGTPIRRSFTSLHPRRPLLPYRIQGRQAGGY